MATTSNKAPTINPTELLKALGQDLVALTTRVRNAIAYDMSAEHRSNELGQIRIELRNLTGFVSQARSSLSRSIARIEELARAARQDAQRFDQALAQIEPEIGRIEAGLGEAIKWQEGRRRQSRGAATTESTGITLRKR